MYPLSHSLKQLTLLVLGSVLILSCRKSAPVAQSGTELDNRFRPYILAYSSGLINNHEPVVVKFTRPVVTPDKVSKKIEEQYFSFSQDVAGTCNWSDEQTLEFTPSAYWPLGKEITASLDLEKIFDTISINPEFSFKFQIPLQHFQFSPGSLTPTESSNMQWYNWQGEIVTNQYATNADIEKLISVKDHSRKIFWKHNDPQHHHFFLDSIERKSEAYDIHIDLIGDAIQAPNKQSHILNIPALGDFKVTQVLYEHDPEPHIRADFSDPLLSRQELNGLFESKDVEFRFIVEGNTIHAYPTKSIKGTISLKILAGIKNQLGYKTKEDFESSVTFEQIKPAIRSGFSEGVIIPKSENISFEFEAVNLKAVDVQITKIYENNVLQFLQSHEMSDNYNLHYVGKEIVARKVSLENSGMDLGRWNRHAIDLSSYINKDPGAIYRIQIRFRKDYALWECNDTTQKSTEEKYDVLTDKPKLWDYYDYYYGYEEDPTPCDDYYYQEQAGINRNILASDLGITSKYANDGTVFSAVTDIKSSDPLPAVKLYYYDRWKQLLGSASTDINGFATTSLKENPTFMVAHYGSQKGYLKYSSDRLSYSKFEVSGSSAPKGVKGFLYGERGVWRPGDSLHVFFILEDAKRLLPPNYPLVFELRDPQGRTVQKTIQKKSLNGFYSFPCVTDPSATTGFYLAQVNVGGITFEKSFQIETIVPNRLKLNLEFSDSILSDNSKTLGTFTAKWLHGADGAGLETDINVSFSALTNPFDKKWSEYSFLDPLYEKHTESQQIPTVTLSENGTAELNNSLTKQGYMPGMLKANFVCKVTEPGGNFSSDYFSTSYSPYNAYVGIKTPEGEGDYSVMLTDQEHNFDVVSLTERGVTNSKDSVVLELYRLDYRYWWDYYDGLSSYNGRYSKTPIKYLKVKLQNGQYRWKLKFNEDEYGYYLVRAFIPGGHSCGQTIYVDYPGWYTRRPKGTEGTPVLNVRSDKSMYKPGEEMRLEIPDALEGNYLVTVERGDKILNASWIKGSGAKSLTHSIKITDDMAPNFYVYISSTQPYYKRKKDQALRRYSVLSLKVDDSKKHIVPLLASKAEWKPEETVAVSVSEKSGKAMTYTLAIVDEGLLDLTHYHTPDPYNYFHAKEALLVNTSDIYGNIIHDFNGTKKSLLSIGGDGGNEGEDQVKRFNPMVRVMGPYFLKEDETQHRKIKLPNYIGSVRVMLVAGNGGAYGSKEMERKVKSPLMLLTSLPRVLTPNDKINFPITIFADKKGIPVTVKIESNDQIQFSGKTTLEYTPTKSGDQTFEFPAQIKASVGVAKISILVQQGKERAHESIEIPVKISNLRQTIVQGATIKSGESTTTSFKPNGIEGTNNVSLEISTMPSLDLEKRLEYLIEYPHGCLEQTTSSVFPQLALSDLIELSTKDKTKIEQNIKAGIARLTRFQVPSGGLGYWQGDPYVNEWGTNYAGHFMIRASKAGYAVPESFMNSWFNYQAKQCTEWNNQQTNERNYRMEQQAYRLYLLALAGKTDYSAMNRLKEHVDGTGIESWLLAGAYAHAGQKNVAETLLNEKSYKVVPYRDLSYNFGSDLRDRALMLEISTLLGKNDKAYAYLEEISTAMCSNRWYNTQETSYCLIAAAAYSKNKLSEKNSIELKMGDTKQNIVFQKPIQRIVLPITTLAQQKVELKNLSNKTISMRLIQSGIPAQGEELDASSGLTVAVRYFDMSGKPIDVSTLKKGTDFIAEMHVKNISKYNSLEELALSYKIPSGWQLHNPRMETSFSTVQTSTAEHTDVRDDAVHYYFDMHSYSYESIDKRGVYMFRIALNASFAGSYYLPATTVEAMYDNKISATQKGRWVIVQ